MGTIKILFLIIICSTFTNLYSQNKEEHLNINLIEYKNDTIDFEIKNISSDTFYTSVYLEMLNYKNDTIKFNRDIFSKPVDFSGTLVISILPKEIKRIRTRLTEEDIFDIVIYSDKKPAKTNQKEKYRLLLKANKSSIDGELFKFYSNWIVFDFKNNN
ncbi:MAG: hypothetical protein H6Q16_1174 [Bacteroidetes bacterium]|nr:hypothetical protein [Bacteroidota bacterium]